MRTRARRAAMGRTVMTLLALAVLLVVPATAPPPVGAASLSDQIEAARKRQEDLARSIVRQESLLEQLDRDQASTAAAIRDTESQLDAINVDQAEVRRKIELALERLERVRARHAELVEELRRSDWTLGLLEQELASGEEDLVARREALGQRLAEAYRAENTTLLEQVFTARSFTDVMSQASAYLAYGDQDLEMAKEIERDQQALDALRLLTTSQRLRTDQLRRATIETRELIELRRAELKEAQRRLALLERKTERIKDQQQARYRQIVSNKREAARIRRQMVNAKAALQRRIAGLVRQAQMRASRQFGVRPGNGSGMFDWPTRGSISGEYGCSSFAWYPPGNGCAHFHDGIDISNGAGTPIYAAADGVVAFVGYRTDGAFVVVMGHAGGYETVYGHLQPRYAVRAGEVVRRGRVIGYMGCTGFCTGTHLHWEVSKDFQTLNPRAFL